MSKWALKTIIILISPDLIIQTSNTERYLINEEGGNLSDIRQTSRMENEHGGWKKFEKNGKRGFMFIRYLRVDCKILQQSLVR